MTSFRVANRVAVTGFPPTIPRGLSRFDKLVWLSQLESEA
jgi:hypothetical protein